MPLAPSRRLAYVSRAVAAVALVAGCGGAAAAGWVITYRIEEIKPPDGATIQGLGLNNKGQVVGRVDTKDGSRAFLYSGGKVTDLGVVDGKKNSQARAINDAGRIVGSRESSRAYEFAPGKAPTDLGVNGESVSINNAGQIAVSSGSGSHRIDPGKAPEKLPAPVLKVGDINAAGVVVGQGQVSGKTHPFRVEPGKAPEDLFDAVKMGTATAGVAQAINANGQIAGAFSNGKAFRYDPALPGPTQAVDITRPGRQAYAWDINADGLVVGVDTKGGRDDPRAFLSDGTNTYDINDFTFTTARPVVFDIARAINDKGQIVVNDRESGRSFLLTPVPEPGGLALALTAAGGGLLLLARRPGSGRSSPAAAAGS